MLFAFRTRYYLHVLLELDPAPGIVAPRGKECDNLPELWKALANQSLVIVFLFSFSAGPSYRTAPRDMLSSAPAIQARRPT
jgi:hypothetical protein